MRVAVSSLVMHNENPRWLGIVVSPPAHDAPLVIGRPGERAVTITSNVHRLFQRDDGVLVQTEAGSRYFVGIAGNVYRCDHLSRTDRVVPPPPPLPRGFVRGTRSLEPVFVRAPETTVTTRLRVRRETPT